MIKVIHISASDKGGAGRATYRIHKSLLWNKRVESKAKEPESHLNIALHSAEEQIVSNHYKHYNSEKANICIIISILNHIV